MENSAHFGKPFLVCSASSLSAVRKIVKGEIIEGEENFCIQEETVVLRLSLPDSQKEERES